MKTTLNQIREHSPCYSGWAKLLHSLNKTRADDEPLDIAYIVKSNGLGDALWCLRAVQGYDKEMRLLAVWCARQVQHLMTDQRSIAALDVAARFADGEATQKELAAACAAAHDAGEAAAHAAEEAAHAAAYAAAHAAAYAAAHAAGEDAAYAAKEAAAHAAYAAGEAAARAAYAAAHAAQTTKLLEICGGWL